MLISPKSTKLNADLGTSWICMEFIYLSDDYVSLASFGDRNQVYIPEAIPGQDEGRIVCATHARTVLCFVAYGWAGNGDSAQCFSEGQVLAPVIAHLSRRLTKNRPRARRMLWIHHASSNRSSASTDSIPRRLVSIPSKSSSSPYSG